jgi:predicted Zn finger-like uncharacterized protein
MYTQCPDCKTAFRVTARVLQQAGGRVRCGGCGSAFNALESLSEELPADRDTSPAADTPQHLDVKKKKLLETLDELTGPENVVIEDTGVEWQVLDETSAEKAASQQDSDDTASMRWTIEKVKNFEPDPEALPEIVNEAPLTRVGGDRRSSAPGSMRFDDNTPLPEDYDDVVTISPPVSPPIPQRREQDKVQIETKHFDEKQFDLALGSADEWVNLLDEVDAAEASGNAALSLEVEEEMAAIHSELTARPATRYTIASAPLEVKGQDAEDMDVTAVARDTEEDEPPSTPSAPLQNTGDFEKEIEVARAALLGEKPEGIVADDKETGELALALVEEPARTADRKSEVAADDDDIAELILRGELESAVVPGTKPGHRPRERRDSRPKRSAAADKEEAPPKPKYPDHLFDENAENVETIIMEGDYVHGSLREQELAARESARKSDEAAFLADTYSMNRNTLRGGKRKTDPAGSGLIVAVVVLALVFAAQVMHNMRQTLSTIGAFNQTVAPIYRLLGQPITPGWDIKGWQFLETRNTIDESGQLLTIRSTVANRSGQALPYPLVHVSLTDRWEEIVGSDVLEPKEYLACDQDPGNPAGPGIRDPSIPVPAGGEFTAVICINSPSPDATGFKLNVCYRVDSEQLRCATEDFRE